jgi:hypothetical protein
MRQQLHRIMPEEVLLECLGQPGKVSLSTSSVAQPTNRRGRCL